LAAAACSSEVSVAKLAQEHGINTNLVFKWRRQFRAGHFGKTTSEHPVLLPVTICVADKVHAHGISTPPHKRAPVDTASTNSAIEIDVAGATIRLRGNVDSAQLRLVLDCLGNSR